MLQNRENESIDRVSSLIAGALAHRGLATHAFGSLALHRANLWLQERFSAASARAVRIEDHVVIIECNHSIVLQELQAQSHDLKRYLSSECQFASIEDVRLIRADGQGGNMLAPVNTPA